MPKKIIMQPNTQRRRLFISNNSKHPKDIGKRVARMGWRPRRIKKESRIFEKEREGYE